MSKWFINAKGAPIEVPDDWTDHPVDKHGHELPSEVERLGMRPATPGEVKMAERVEHERVKARAAARIRDAKLAARTAQERFAELDAVVTEAEAPPPVETNKTK